MEGTGRNPDLLFEDERTRRVERLLAHREPDGRFDCRDLPLDRVTVFLTHRCNFRCDYCNGPHRNDALPAPLRLEALRRAFEPAQFERLLDEWQGRGLKHLHFTGGEATVDPNLRSYVAGASRRGMLVTLTTNGSAPPALYLALARAGMTEVRISIDSSDAARFDAQVHVRGAFDRVERTIRTLVQARDEGLRLFVVLNVTLQRFELEPSSQTIAWLLSLRPDDVKLLVASESAALVRGAGSRASVEQLLRVESDGRPAQGFPLLARKIRHLFRRDAFGLRGPDARNLMRRCYLPLTERTLDARGIHPCSIQLRYFAPPLAAADAPFDVQQEALRRFVEEHDCLADPICVQHCTRCCREFNVETGLRLREQELSAAAGLAPVRVGRGAPTATDEERVRRTVRAILDTPPASRSPFLIIRPGGMARREEILRYLEEQGVAPQSTHLVRNWGEFAFYLHLRPEWLAWREKLRQRLARASAYRELERGRALLVRTEPGVPLKKLARIKAELRRWMGERRLPVALEGGRALLRLSPVHSPDFEDLPWENRVAEFFLGAAAQPAD